MDLGFFHPFPVGCAFGQFGLDFGIVNNAAMFQVDQEHFAWLQAPFLDDLMLGNVQHPHFRCHHHIIIIGDQVTGRP